MVRLLRSATQLAVALLFATPLGHARPASAAAQEPVVRGTVRRADTGEPLEYALVRAVADSGPPVSTDIRVRFTLALPTRGTARLLVVRLGFAPDTVDAASGAELEIGLRPAPVELAPLVAVAGRAPARFTARLIQDVDLELRPSASSQELLRLAPGLVVAQHAGGGKAEQVFLRGFDADHGTDVRSVTGSPPVQRVRPVDGPLGGLGDLSVTASSFAARWDASGQIPERAVRKGLIGRFGAIDPSEGGSTSRPELWATLRSGSAERR
jgi:hypothetical protein